MSEQHLDLLPAMTRTLVGRRVCQASGNIPRIFVEGKADIQPTDAGRRPTSDICEDMLCNAALVRPMLRKM